MCVRMCACVRVCVCACVCVCVCPFLTQQYRTLPQSWAPHIIYESSISYSPHIFLLYPNPLYHLTCPISQCRPPIQLGPTYLVSVMPHLSPIPRPPMKTPKSPFKLHHLANLQIYSLCLYYDFIISLNLFIMSLICLLFF